MGVTQMLYIADNMFPSLTPTPSPPTRDDLKILVIIITNLIILTLSAGPSGPPGCLLAKPIRARSERRGSPYARKNQRHYTGLGLPNAT